MSPADKLIDYDKALGTILSHVRKVGTRRVELADARGAVLREDVHADRDQPPFNRSAMDGFAVRSGQVAVDRLFTVAGAVAAGAPIAEYPDDPASVLRIATGAAVPPGADAVIPIEQAQVESGDRSERVRFLVESVEPGHNIHARASDASTGQRLVAAGTGLGANHLAAAAAVGATQLEVSAEPRVALLTSGDEVMAPQTPTAQLQPQQIRNSNGPLLAGLLNALGASPIMNEHVPDEPEQTLDAAREAIGQSNLVITVGGVSVGQRDLLPWAWQRLGLEVVLHGVAIQPGKPLFVARDGNKLVLGLPGNPVSVLITAHLFVWPVIRAMLGQAADLPWLQVTLGNGVKAKRKRQVFRAARLNGQGIAEVIQWHGSGDLVHTVDADGFVRLPLIDAEAQAGQRVPFLPLIR